MFVGGKYNTRELLKLRRMYDNCFYQAVKDLKTGYENRVSDDMALLDRKIKSYTGGVRTGFNVAWWLLGIGQVERKETVYRLLFQNNHSAVNDLIEDKKVLAAQMTMTFKHSFPVQLLEIPDYALTDKRSCRYIYVGGGYDAYLTIVGMVVRNEKNETKSVDAKSIVSEYVKRQRKILDQAENDFLTGG